MFTDIVCLYLISYASDSLCQQQKVTNWQMYPSHEETQTKIYQLIKMLTAKDLLMRADVINKMFFYILFM